MSHRYWCPAYVTTKDRASGIPRGRCTCRKGTERCMRTQPLFPELDLVSPAKQRPTDAPPDATSVDRIG